MLNDFEKLPYLAQNMKRSLSILNHKKYMKTKLLITMPLFLSASLFGALTKRVIMKELIFQSVM